MPLDQLADTPRPDEQIHVYQIKRVIGFACTRGKGCNLIVEYFHCPEQPSEEILRDNAKWAQWCQERSPEPHV